MAKKKKAALKPNPARGFATTSTPSKRPEPAPEPEPAPAAAAPEAPAPASDAPHAARPGAAEQWDPASAEEMALQGIVERVWDRAEKETSRTWKVIEFDRRLAASLPSFAMDIPLRDRILALAPQPSTSSAPDVSFASLYPALGPASLPTVLLARALTTHALLLRLGFNSAQADEALHVAGVDVEEAAAYLYATLPDDEADAARSRCNRGERDETAEDTTLPPQHPGYTFERTVPTRAAPPPAPRTPAAAAAPLNLSPGELALRREALRAKIREVTALAAELSSAWEGVEPLEDPNGSWGRARAGIVRIDRTSAQLAKAKVAANESEAQPALRAEVAEAEKRLVAIKAEVESVREQAGRGKWFDKKAGEEAFKAEVARVELLEKEREEQRKLEKAELEDGSVDDEERSTPAASAASTAAPEEATPQSTAPPSAAPSGPPSEAGDASAASDDDAPMFGDMLDEAPTEQTDEATGELITVYPLPAAALRGGGGGKMPRALLGEALRRIDPASSARFEQLGGRSVCRSRLHLRWTPPGAQKAVLDVFTLTTLAAGSPSAADELLAVLALSCIERERHVERGLGKGWREWWDELEVARASERDARRRTHVSRIGEIVAPRLEEERKKDEEKARLKREKAAAAASSGGVVSHADVDGSGAVTPADEQRDVQAPAPGKVYSEEEAESVRAMWQRRTSEERYAAMLPGRQGLPIANFKEHILEIMANNQIFVLSGETGCGKSTQVPAYIVESCLSQGMPCRVYVTEPRRISAISLAERVSQELGEAPGVVGSDWSLVGSGVRLESKIGKNARLVYATTGIVLRMLEGGRLEGITHIILDEVHERSIESDFLLIILKSLMEVRKDLKVILMSATLDAERISAYFGGCPTVAVPGRTFPVDVRYLEDAVELCDYIVEDGSPYARRPKRWNSRKADVPGNRAKLASTEEDDAPDPDDDDDDERDGPASSGLGKEAVKRYQPKTISTLDRLDENVIQHELIVSLIERICLQDAELQAYSAAILVFLPGIADIRKLNDILQAHRVFGSQSFRIFPLHSTISSEDQGSVFALPPKGVRKIVIATNIAETGITIPDITCVIDSGKHREMRFDEKRQLSRLVECFVAKSNAKQRRGRAGRVQKGLCFHLFTKLRHDNYFADHPLPEILRLSLQDLALKLKVMKVRIGSSIEDALTKAMDPPSSVNIQRAISALVEVKALTTSEEITPLGRHLSRLPLDVHMGKFLLTAALMKALDPALTIAATLNSKSPFITPFGREQEADRAKASFAAGNSDFVTCARAFEAWRRSIDNNFARQFCSKNFLSPQNLQQIEELRQQYLGYLIDSGFVQVDAQTKQDLARARFRGGRARAPLQLPAELSLNANSLAVLNAALCTGLYPKLLAIEPRSFQLRTIGNNAPASIHPSSVNFRMRFADLPRGVNHLVYFTIMQSRKLYAWETGAVDDRALILMCGDADFKITSTSLYIDRQRIRFIVPDAKSLLALRVLREQLNRLINASFRSPGKAWSEEQTAFFNLAAEALGRGANERDRVLQG